MPERTKGEVMRVNFYGPYGLAAAQRHTEAAGRGCGRGRPTADPEGAAALTEVSCV
ncbi:MAG: hypothetical protein LBR80_08105 [Deltaproteobacteria bacterium]|nr:hypothetical protein [Deltaproteobacteria bacterium]